MSPPRYRTIFIIDIEASTDRTDPEKAHLRSCMYNLYEQALRAGGLTDRCRDPFSDRGDGILTLFHPVDEAPKTVLLDTVVPTLGALLREHNARHPEQWFRLRAVVHAGEVTYDDNGCFGEAIDVAFRLLESNDVKRTLARTQAPMVLVVSDHVYDSVVRHRHHGIDPAAYRRRPKPRVAGRRHRGWIRVVEGTYPADPPRLPLAARDRPCRARGRLLIRRHPGQGRWAV